MLAQCIESIQPALKSRAEIIVVDNDSSDPETLDYLAMIEGDIAQVLRVPGDFNFARLNNIAASVATGDHLLLLNNDIKALDTDWLDEMLTRLAEPDVGAVGALLLWPSGIVQHGGVVLGPGFAATHAFNDRMRGDAGYGDLLRVAHQCSAVTAACLLTRRADFHLVGGLDEFRFPVNFNDVDYCLKSFVQSTRGLCSPRTPSSCTSDRLAAVTIKRQMAEPVLNANSSTCGPNGAPRSRRIPITTQRFRSIRLRFRRSPGHRGKWRRAPPAGQSL